uniref:Uncharacterized protein n=1 Tax=Nelumbo nucifera TaxID=4432 RepID=A0A822Y303_NELNU|nr:TPA_asm: hypothetical protein HUJ06_029762 [Nelumbo nucifera]
MIERYKVSGFSGEKIKQNMRMVFGYTDMNRWENNEKNEREKRTAER